MSRYPITTLPAQHQTVMVGEIVSASLEMGMAVDVSYRVILHHSAGSTIYQNAYPHHRRPSDTTEILAAKPGDRCFIQDPFGSAPKFIIFEGLVTGDC